MDFSDGFFFSFDLIALITNNICNMTPGEIDGKLMVCVLSFDKYSGHYGVLFLLVPQTENCD